MRRFKLSILLFMLVASLCAFSFVAVRALWWSPQSDITPPAQNQASVASSLSAPVRLTIPSLGIDAHVQPVGITASGNMAVPTNFTDVGWYKYGALPGQQGSAVMDGHVDNALSLPGVFKHLTAINVGDDIYIEERDGQKLHFVVYDIETYPYRAVPMETVFAATSSSNLNLITCQGSWLQSGRTYDHRVVVYARLKR